MTAAPNPKVLLLMAYRPLNALNTTNHSHVPTAHYSVHAGAVWASLTFPSTFQPVDRGEEVELGTDFPLVKYKLYLLSSSCQQHINYR